MIYLIHFHTKLSHAQHYLGFVEHDLEERFKLHLSGRGAKILRRCNEMFIGYDIVATFPGDRTLERKMKNSHNIKRYCPICNAIKHGKEKRKDTKSNKGIEDVSNMSGR